MKFVAWFGEVDKDDTGICIDWAFEGDRPEENDSEARLRASATSGSSRPGTMAADG